MNHRRTALSALLILVPFVGLWEGAASVFPIHREAPVQTTKGTLYFSPGQSPAEAYLPRADWDFSDLDVRDAQNRPVRAVSAQLALAELFHQNLVLLLLQAPPHLMREMLIQAATFSRLLHNAFFAVTEGVCGALALALPPGPKRLVHNVDKVWITVSVGVFAVACLFAFSLSKRATIPLVLRC